MPRKALTEPQKKAQMELAKAASEALKLGPTRLGALLGHKAQFISDREAGASGLTPTTEHLYQLFLAAVAVGLRDEVIAELESVPLPRNEGKAITAISTCLAVVGKASTAYEVIGRETIAHEDDQPEADMNKPSEGTIAVMRGLASGFERRARVEAEPRARRLREAASKMASVIHEYEQAFEEPPAPPPGEEKGEGAKG